MADIILTPERAKKFSYSIPYFYDSLIFAIPPAKAYSSLEKLFFPFKTTVWWCICASFVVVSIIILILKSISKSKRDFVFGRNNDAPFFNLISTCLGGVITEYQLPRRNFARTIVGIVLLTTLILRNAYLGNLFNFLRMQKRMEPLYYIQDIFESDVTLFVPEVLCEKYQVEFPSIRHR